MLKVKEITEMARKINELNINVAYNVITNGVFLNYDNVKMLLDVGVTNYQITIDGNKEIHDMRRPCKNVKISCYDTIINNLDDLFRYNIFNEIGISIRINVDSQNANYLTEIYNKLPIYIRKNENSNSVIYIAPIVGIKTDNCNKLLSDRANNLIKCWEQIRNNNLNISIKPPVYAPCPVHSINSGFYIDLKGNIYICGGFVGDTDYIEKHYKNRFKLFYDRINDSPSDNCFKCAFFPVCMGGCKMETKALGVKCQYNYLKLIYDEYYCNYTNNRQNNTI